MEDIFEKRIGTNHETGFSVGAWIINNAIIGGIILTDVLSKGLVGP